HDLVRHREHVLRLVEQRVARRVDLVKGEAGMELAEPERNIAADQVDLMPALGQLDRQLGRDDPAAADRRVADDADVHRSCGRTTGSFTTNPSAKATPASAPNCASRLSIS